MKKLVFVVALILSCPALFGQSKNLEMRALFMYSFTRFVQWPPEESTGDFEIVVLGESPIVSEFKAMAERKKAGARTIKVTKIASLADYKKCHILYVPSDWTSKYQEVTAKVGDAPVLLVTDQAPVTSKGCINFVNDKEGKLAFELNQALLGKHKLRASAELSRLAIIN
jgi:hypothetical protein